METQASKKSFTIAHATDLDPNGGVAFRHSVALARDTDSVLYSLHANPVSREDGRKMPDANEMLRQWHWNGGNGSDAPTVEFHKMLHECCDDAVDTLLDAMRRIEPDLLVVGKHQSGGFFEIMHDSVSEALALNTNIPTLFLPLESPGFVDEESGAMKLERILVPVQDEATFLQSFEKVGELLERMGNPACEVVLLHVGDDDVLDSMVVPETDDKTTWKMVEGEGDLAEAIFDCVENCTVDLIVMGTRGHDSIGDVFRGSRTQRVVRRSPCPVLSVPLVD
ncbi:universal stress protein [Persicimonas caeni]|uniref:Universal stress protein n=1 Tax=Persicimonas caeni TaxID=2292766 RepID=A0A4Y6Q0L0_PERCE|nr:universal stress protein [Persicimonas caeni]QDG53535.1 universal stress protein [Persicimonas caeni]QED34756.1 universal stress protein [Persicimonas caeni]